MSTQQGFAGIGQSDRTAPTPLLPVSLENVCFGVNGADLLHDVSLTIGPGNRTVIMGPNGAGKSLLLRLMQGLISPTRGKLTWRRDWNSRQGTQGGTPGSATGGMPSGAPPVSIVLQRPVLLRRSVAANLTHALRVLRVPRAERAARLEELLTLGNLQDRRDQPARSLSGGEQQRLATVRALAASPEMLLLDEPTASLDPQATHAIEGLIQSSHERGTKIVMVTHDMGQAKRIADEVVFVSQGRIAEFTPAETFFTQPQSEEARAYLSGQLVI
ncbi:ATP-binding cassette domain-containing protein [Hwanghaeella grinnelliae]|uniref:ATP-binding cassette domain-containing protein n=1 Tax=Hwanghaeella grinnelliae TaxID=2500179 RepID=A0A437QI22_9PROT|nr:ATP-binding cassette domain-containing protein [Hwanghaeella grinnelliae]RVU34076.1 ATP-binding cassette domain-containing protein [Hwanghaeella grinnelliae]